MGNTIPDDQSPERRSGHDRRSTDEGPPPGRRDRRVGVEPRQPEVQEVPFTSSLWAEFDDSPVAPGFEPTQPQGLTSR